MEKTDEKIIDNFYIKSMIDLVDHYFNDDSRDLISTFLNKPPSILTEKNFSLPENDYIKEILICDPSLTINQKLKSLSILYHFYEVAPETFFEKDLDYLSEFMNYQYDYKNLIHMDMITYIFVMFLYGELDKIYDKNKEEYSSTFKRFWKYIKLSESDKDIKIGGILNYSDKFKEGYTLFIGDIKALSLINISAFIHIEYYGDDKLFEKIDSLFRISVYPKYQRVSYVYKKFTCLIFKMKT